LIEQEYDLVGYTSLQVNNPDGTIRYGTYVLDCYDGPIYVEDLDNLKRKNVQCKFTLGRPGETIKATDTIYDTSRKGTSRAHGTPKSVLGSSRKSGGGSRTPKTPKTPKTPRSKSRGESGDETPKKTVTFGGSKKKPASKKGSKKKGSAKSRSPASRPGSSKKKPASKGGKSPKRKTSDFSGTPEPQKTRTPKKDPYDLTDILNNASMMMPDQKDKEKPFIPNEII